ncbi:MAG: alpha/beta hydrolase [Treponema sp.]|nr:alpha/beta hydrolase [Treponema sp.]
MSSSKDRQNAIKKLKTLCLSPKIDPKVFREKIENCFSNPLLPNRIEWSEREFGGVMCDVLMPEVYSSKRIMLYVHGGSFVGGSRGAWRSFCSSLAHATSCRVVVPEFRLSPPYQYPSSLEDVQSVFRNMYTEEQIARSLDIDSSDASPEIIIAADGSGASIALALVLSLKGKFRDVIKQIVLFSPWLDVSAESKHLSAKKGGDEIYTVDAVRRAAEFYTFPQNRANPLVSPLLADDQSLHGFPATYIQMGEKELFLDDAERFQARLADNGCECTLDVWPRMMPCFQMADECLSESHLAIEKVGHLITGRDSRRNESDTSIHIVLEKSLNGF